MSAIRRLVIECRIAGRVREANRIAEREREREPDEPVDWEPARTTRTTETTETSTDCDR